jgi:hypothetical protein
VREVDSFNQDRPSRPSLKKVNGDRLDDIEVRLTGFEKTSWSSLRTEDIAQGIFRDLRENSGAFETGRVNGKAHGSSIKAMDRFAPHRCLL